MRKKDKPLKVLILTHTYSDIIVGGETKAAWEMTNALAARGVKIYVVTTFVKIGEATINPNIKIYKIPFSKQTRDFDKLSMFKTFIYALPIIFLKKIDIIHLINTQGPHPFAYFKIRPFVSTVDLQWNYDDSQFKNELFHDRRLKIEEFGLAGQQNNIFDKFLNKLACYFFKVFKMNESLPRSIDLCAYRHNKLFSQLKESHTHSRLVYIPVGVDTDRFKPDNKVVENKKNKLIFLFVGTISKRKGVEYLIKAFNQLSERYKNIRLLLVGPGALETIDSFKKIIIPSADVTFLGALTTNEIIKYYNVANVFVAPSIGIDLGINKSVIEAMACGLPVIITYAHDTEALNGQVGFCVDAGKTEELVGSMAKFINNPLQARIMGEKAREFALNNHNWAILAERLEWAYKKIVF